MLGLAWWAGLEDQQCLCKEFLTPRLQLYSFSNPTDAWWRKYDEYDIYSPGKQKQYIIYLVIPTLVLASILVCALTHHLS